jgi:predicted nucleic acid-binding protein
VRAYADSSFIVRLITAEPDSAAAIGEYRRAGLPPLFFLPLHTLEVRNAILQRAFHQRRSSPARERRHVARERDAALGRLERLIRRQSLLEVALDAEAAIVRASQLSITHTERVGARAIDLLHVASALMLDSELFFTADSRQAALAAAEGLKVVNISPVPA